MSFVAEELGINRDVNKYEVNTLIPFPYGVGIEVELEFKGDLPEPRLKSEKLNYWNQERDGSLKGGVEYVTVSPLVSSSVVKALVELNASLKEHKEKPILSERTSVHVHVDARDMSREQIGNFILLYLVFEKVLFQFCGADRAKNVFCLSAMDSDGIVASLAKFFNAESNRHAVRSLQEYQRYSSLNLQSLTKFGSIELRSHRGEYKTRPITNWVNILLSLKHYVMQHEDIWGDLPNNISAIGPEKFMVNVFGKYAKLLDYQGVENDIIEGIRVAQNVMFSKNYVELAQKLREEAATKSTSKLFLNYMERKYPAVWTARQALADIKKTVVGNEKSYKIDQENFKVITDSEMEYPIQTDNKGYFFVNVAKTKVYLSKEAQGSMYHHRYFNGHHDNVQLEQADEDAAMWDLPQDVQVAPARDGAVVRQFYELYDRVLNNNRNGE